MFLALTVFENEKSGVGKRAWKLNSEPAIFATEKQEERYERVLY